MQLGLLAHMSPLASPLQWSTMDTKLDWISTGPWLLRSSVHLERNSTARRLNNGPRESTKQCFSPALVWLELRTVRKGKLTRNDGTLTLAQEITSTLLRKHGKQTDRPTSLITH